MNRILDESKVVYKPERLATSTSTGASRYPDAPLPPLASKEPEHNETNPRGCACGQCRQFAATIKSHSYEEYL